MVMQPTYGHGFSDNPTIEMSQEGLRSILSEIEMELMDSEVYRRTMAGLQTMLGEASSTAQILVKAVGREAVRLTCQQFAKQYKIVPITAESINQAQEQDLEIPQKPVTPPTPTTITDNLDSKESPSLVEREIGETKPRKKLTKAELTAQKLAQERAQLLHQVGQELRQARHARCLTVEQLYRQTLVPIHQIEALEAGRIEHLPEDVYIRGFICRLSQALGLNGIAIAASVPTPDPVKSVVPSWYHDPSESGFQLRAIHLYLGYAALIAGAVGGLNWMSNQSQSGTSVEPEPANSAHTSTDAKSELVKSSNKPGLQSSTTGIKAGADIAPPEALPF